MDNKLLITVVIPVYNVEPYLEECLNSVINQTYSNLEIICVDDASTDGSLKILKNYEKKDSRIKVLRNPQNIGLGLTRNEGIKVANGDYIHCLDSDDWLELDAYETLVKKLKEFGDVDFINFRYRVYDMRENKIKESIEDISGEIYDKVLNIMENPHLYDYYNSAVWNKLMKTEYIRRENLYYNDYRCFEDFEYSMLALLKTQAIVFVREILINYRNFRPNSLLSKKSKYISNLVKDVQMANSLACDMHPNMRSCFLRFGYNALIWYLLEEYYKFRFAYKDLRRIFAEDISSDVLEEHEMTKYYATLHKKITSYSALKFRLFFQPREFVKRNFPNFAQGYLANKKRLISFFKK